MDFTLYDAIGNRFSEDDGSWNGEIWYLIYTNITLFADTDRYEDQNDFRKYQMIGRWTVDLVW
jgi:hypothetical protein